MKDETAVQTDAHKLLTALGRPVNETFLTFIKEGDLQGRWADPDGNWADLNADGYNAYFSPNPVKPDFTGTKASKIPANGSRKFHCAKLAQ